MKSKILYPLFFLLFFSFNLKAQFEAKDDFGSKLGFVDSLTIFRDDGHRIFVVWPYKENIKNSDEWESLLDNFQEDLQKIITKIPDYDFLKINYVNKNSLIVDEIIGRETYTIDGQDDLVYIKSNLSRLQGENVIIKIEFTEESSLLDPSIKTDIQEALKSVHPKLYFSGLSANRYKYSMEEKKLMPGDPTKFNLVIPLGARLGYLKDDQYIEFQTGIGVAINRKTLLSFNLDVMNNYNSILNENQRDIYLGLGYGSFREGLRLEFGFKLSDEIDNYEDLKYRTRLRFKLKNIDLGLEIYSQSDPGGDSNNNTIFGISAGYDLYLSY